MPETIMALPDYVKDQLPKAPVAGGKLDDMAVTLPYARRLTKLLKYLDVDQAEFARRTGIDPGYISRILSGDRGKRALPTLTLGAEKAFGIDGHYWSSPVDIDPSKCRLPMSQQNATTEAGDMGRMVGRQEWAQSQQSDARAKLATLAAERHESPEMIAELLRETAPADADSFWWFRRYLELRDEYASQAPRKRV